MSIIHIQRVNKRHTYMRLESISGSLNSSWISSRQQSHSHLTLVSWSRSESGAWDYSWYGGGLGTWGTSK